MSNPNRKMVTVRRVDDVRPIEGADRIELAIVGGWQVVVGKGSFKPGDIGCYFEIDSFLRADDERYKEFQSESLKEMAIDGRFVKGSVLRTRKFRGVYSQGLLLKPQDVLPSSIPESAYEQMCERGANVSGLANVVEYESMQPMNAGFSGKYDGYIAPRTDCERAQNVSQQIWDLAKRTEYQCSIKVDGASITMVYDDRVNELTHYSHNNRFDMDSPGIPQIVRECAEKQGLADFCRDNHMVTLQCELVGPKLQGNRLRLKEHRLMVFSIWSIKESRYLEFRELDGMDSANGVLESHVPVIDTGVLLNEFDTPQDFLAWVDGIRDHVTKGCLDEGVVVHIYDRGDLDNDEWFRLQNALSSTMQIKAVSNKFLLKAKD